MADYAFSYWLARTVFTVRGTTTVAPVGGESGTFLENRPGATIEPALEADLAMGRQRITVSVGAWENVTLELGFSDDGYIESINSEAGRDPVPLIKLGADIVTAATSAGLRTLSGRSLWQGEPDRTAAPTSLEEQWRQRNDILARLEPKLSARYAHFLDAMAAETATAEEVVDCADAADALQSQLALIGSARRAWIAAQTEVHSTTETLHVADLHRLDALTGIVAGSAGEPSDIVLIAIVDTERAATTAPAAAAAAEWKDRLPLRRPRPVTIAVYTRQVAGADWTLSPETVRRMHVVDEFSPLDEVDLDGRWWTKRSFGLGYHPDGSVKVLKITSAPTVGDAAGAAGGLLTALAAAKKSVDDAPTADEQRLAQAETQLKLLQTTTDLEALAATSSRAEELAVLEQLSRIRAARS